jgi:hypothetical protein
MRFGRASAVDHVPRTVLVFEHDSGTLRSMFVSGGIGFLHDMLESPEARTCSRT